VLITAYEPRAEKWDSGFNWFANFCLATFGKEPADQSTKAFVSRQLWYMPRQTFNASELTDSQKAVLKEFDAEVARLR